MNDDAIAVLKEIREQQREQIALQRDALVLMREQFALTRTQLERAERLNDRAEALQDRASRTMRIIGRVAIPLVLLALVLLLWLQLYALFA